MCIRDSVDTDLAVPSQLDRVRVSVRGPTGEVVQSDGRLAGEAALTLPVTLGVVPGGAALGPVVVVASGLLGEQEVVHREAAVEFVRDERRVLRLVLLARCVGVPCADGTSCGESGACGLTTVPPEQLRPFRQSDG